MDDDRRTVGAKCRTCGRNLTVAEFRACDGMGHFCTAHRSGEATPKPVMSKPRRKRSVTSRAGRRVTESGDVEYPCKGQFASNGVIRAGKLADNHPSCPEDGWVFVCRNIGYGPGEIARLFIRNAEGRDFARRAGYEVSE